MTTSKTVLLSASLIWVSFFIGCDYPRGNGTRQSRAAADAEKLAAMQAELHALAADLSLTQQQVIAAESKAADSEARYREAVEQAARLEQTANETKLLLDDAEKRIAAAQQALANQNNRDYETVANSDNQFEPLAAKFFSWNVESDGSDPLVIAKQLAEFPRYDAYGLTEVLPEAFSIYANALGDSYASIESKTGNTDRLQILYDKTRFDLVRKFELHDINFQYRYRSPLVAHLREQKSGIEFLVMVNHLARGKEEIRTQQAQQLVEWARDQNLPIVAIGDYNYDYVFADKNGNEGFREMLKDNIWKWVEPAEMIDSNWFDNPEQPDGQDDYPGSLLDFAYVAGSAKAWNIVCNIIVRPGDFPDDETTSDHRPFELLINP